MGILVAVTTAAFGVFFGTAALHGYAIGRINPVERLVCVLFAVALLLPSGVLGTEGLVKTVGVVAAIAYIGWKLAARRTQLTATSS